MNNELIIYQTEDGQTQVNLKAIDGTVWLIQDEIANLFGKSRSTIAEHLQHIFNDGELEENSVRRNFRRTAEDQAKKRKSITMAEWEQKLDAFLSFNERELLTHAGTIRASVAKQLAEERYDLFDKYRQIQELEQANTDDIAELEQIVKQINKGMHHE